MELRAPMHCRIWDTDWVPGLKVRSMSLVLGGESQSGRLFVNRKWRLCAHLFVNTKWRLFLSKPNPFY